MKGYRYSNFPMEAYKLPIQRDEVDVIGMFEEAQRLPIWNLFWLSNPTIDAVPGSGSRWHRHYAPLPGLLVSVFQDVLDRSDLMGAVTSHPSQFMVWFCGQNAAEFRTYDIAGRVKWMDNVLERSQKAADGLLKVAPVKYDRDGKLTIG